MTQTELTTRLVCDPSNSCCTTIGTERKVCVSAEKHSVVLRLYTVTWRLLELATNTPKKRATSISVESAGGETKKLKESR